MGWREWDGGNGILYFSEWHSEWSIGGAGCGFPWLDWVWICLLGLGLTRRCRVAVVQGHRMWSSDGPWHWRVEVVSRKTIV